MRAKPVRLKPPWVAYIVRCRAKNLPEVQARLITVLCGISLRSSLRFNFNAYNTPKDPHLSIRVNTRSHSLETILESFKRVKLVRSWERAKYDEHERTAGAYEAASRAYLHIGERLTGNDLGFTHMFFHGLWNNLFTDHIRGEGRKGQKTNCGEDAYWLEQAIGVVKDAGHVLAHAAWANREASDASPADTLRRLLGKKHAMWRGVKKEIVE